MSDQMGAQFGLAKLLRPFKGWETTYQGKSGLSQIYFFPVDKDNWGISRDPLAPLDGYHDNLGNAHAVPMGSLTYIWLPRLTYSAPPNRVGYTWLIGWRMRTLRCFQLKKAGAYHLPFNAQRGSRGEGFPVQVPLLYAADGVVYEQTESSTQLQRQHYKQPEGLNLGTIGTGDAAIGAIAGYHQDGQDVIITQGMEMPIGSRGNVQGAFIPIERRAEGDELVVSCFREDAGAAPYNFNAGGVDFDMADKINSTTSPFIGVYAWSGSNY